MQSVACPQCKKPADLSADNPWRPFCSERCKLIDLGEWFEECHSIESDGPEEWAQDFDPPEPSRH